MAKHNNTGRNKELFVRIPFGMVDSPAFAKLSCHAIALYIRISRRYNGSNNGDISYSCREAQRDLRIGKATAAKAFNELMGHGFIKVSQNASFNYKSKQARRWGLTNWPLKHGCAPSNEWRFWNLKNLEHGSATGTDGSASGTARHP
jgi:hypothetical protein